MLNPAAVAAVAAVSYVYKTMSNEPKKYRLKILQQSKKNTLCLWRGTENDEMNELNDDLPLRTFPSSE